MNPAKAQQIEQDLRRLLGEFESMVESAGTEGAAAFGEMRHRLSAAASEARRRLDAMDARLRNRARHAAELTDTYVHDSPWQVIGAAALLGFLAGMLIARR